MAGNQRKLLSVLAHPDDESFGMGGTLALYAEQGVAVHLVCATRGEAGEVGADHLNGHASIAELREAELRCAVAHLGLTSVRILGYRDSGMPGSPDNEHPRALIRAPLDEVAAKIVHHMREIRPHVVLTFDSIGGYHHPDHIAIHKATVRAFHWAGDPDFDDGLPPHQPEKLYFHTIPKRFIRLAVRLIRLFGKDPSKWGKNGDIDLASLAAEDFPVNALIDYRRVKKRKDAASLCHASQGGIGLSKGPLHWLARMTGGQDQFVRAFPPPNDGEKETDLFAGIQPETQVLV